MNALRGAGELDAWLAPFLDVMGRKTRRSWAPLYLRGLLGPGERKSLQPMAASLGPSGHDPSQHFIASPAWDAGRPRAGAGRGRAGLGRWRPFSAGPAWDDGPLWRVLAEQADRVVGGAKAALV